MNNVFSSTATAEKNVLGFFDLSQTSIRFNLPLSAVMCLFLLQISLLSVFAQTAEGPPADEPGCATERAEKLKFLEGEWDVVNRFRLSGRDNKWEKTEARAVIRPLFANCLWFEELRGTRAGRPHRVIGLYSYNNITDKLQWTGAHSEHGVLTLYEGDFEGGELKLESALEIRGRKFLFRRLITKTPQGFEVRSQRSLDGGKSWDTSWHLTYSRQ